jgi:multidrug efflux pump subunit AcrB
VVVTLEVKKRAGENLLEATDKIMVILDEARERFPTDLTLETSNDTSRQTRTQVDNLENSIISGVILVVLVLLFFLGLRNAMFVGIAIPLSMLMGFLILSATGITMNVVVLFSLILALGMLVDNGIVVVENVYRLMSEGNDHSESAKQGVGEVAWPIITSTLTTLAAFFPLVFWNDIMGEFMKYLPLTLIIVLSSSLFVALVINPVLTSMFMEVQETKKRSKLSKRQWILVSLIFIVAAVMYVMGFKTGIPQEPGLGPNYILIGNILMAIVLLVLINVYILTPVSYRFQNVFLGRLERFYDWSITWALKTWRPYFIFGSMFGLLFFSLWFFGVRQPDVVTFPENIPNYVNIFIELPTGTDLDRTNEFTEEVEEIVKETLKPYYDQGVIESYLTNVGEGTSDPNAGNPVDIGTSSNKAKITVSFVEYQDRLMSDGSVVSTEEILNKLRSSLDTVAGAKISVDKDPNGPPLGPPISIEISGDNFDSLIAISTRVKALIEGSDIKGIEELKSDLDVGKPELKLIPNSEAIGLYGLSNQQVLGTIRTALYGMEVSKFKGIDRGFNGEEDDIPIELRLMDKYRYDIEDLLSQRVTYRDQADGKIKQVPISAVVELSYETTYGSVNRKDQDRMVTLYSNVLDGYNLNDIIAQLDLLFRDYQGVPEGYDINFSGEKAEQEKSMAFLQSAFMIAIFLIAIILVSQFNSLAKPVIILLSVVFSTIGVFLGIAFFRMDFVVIMTGIGIISLAGVVVNNAIVLIDYTDLVRRRRREELGYKGDRLPKDLIVECIKEGGMTRLRPVLLTAVTTVLGLIPLAIGLNINFFRLFTHLDPQIYVGGDQVIFWGPMSKTIIMGLTFATFLTLIVVPVMYLIFDRIAYRVFVWVKGEEALEDPSEET